MLIPGKHSKFGAKNFNEVCPKTVHNALKWPLQYVNFQNFSGVAYALKLSGAFFFSLTCFKLILPEKNIIGKMSKFGAPFVKEFLITPQT